MILAADETDLRLFPPLRAGWAKRGEPARVVITGYNARRVVFGAMNLRTGARLLAGRGRRDDASVAAQPVARAEPAGYPEGQAKDVLSANKQYADVDQQADRLPAHLRGLSGRRALETSGVPSESCWLRYVLSKNSCGPA